MSSLLELGMVIGTLAVGLVIGQVLYIKAYSESRGFESLLRLIFNTAWLLSAVYLALGGYHLSAMFIAAIGFYFWRSNVTRVRESDLEASTLRSILANFRPSNGRRRH